VVGAAGGAIKTSASLASAPTWPSPISANNWTNRAAGGFTAVFDGAGGAVDAAALSLTDDARRLRCLLRSIERVRRLGRRTENHRRPGTARTRRRSIAPAHPCTGVRLLADQQVRPVIGQQVPLSDAARLIVIKWALTRWTAWAQLRLTVLGAKR
jgi:hypothetical protein